MKRFFLVALMALFLLSACAPVTQQAEASVKSCIINVLASSLSADGFKECLVITAIDFSALAIEQVEAMLSGLSADAIAKLSALLGLPEGRTDVQQVKALALFIQEVR